MVAGPGDKFDIQMTHRKVSFIDKHMRSEIITATLWVYRTG